MFQEKIEKERFNGNRGRDAFIDQLLDVIDPITEDDKKEIAELLEHL
jgi:hypothetical protein